MIQPRTDTERLENVHGGVDYEELARLGLRPDQVIDFSSNILPDGPAPGVIHAVQRTEFSNYPDRECLELRQSIADHLAIPTDQIIVGNGCCELIHSVAQAIIGEGDRTLVVGPTFSEYARASRIAGGLVISCNAVEQNDFAIPVERIETELASQKVRLVWICTPNNPTGQLLSQDILLDWLSRYPETIFVVDESYIEFAKRAETAIRCSAPNLIVLRSMTKSFAIAGLRLGYAVLRDPWATELTHRRIPWSVNVVAQAAGLAALKETENYSASMSQLLGEKHRLMDQIASLGLRTLPSHTGFFLMKTQDSRALRDHLLTKGLLVRDCNSFGLDGFVRIATGTAEQNAILVAALANKPSSNQVISNQPFPVSSASKTWDETFRDQLRQLFQYRRDVRRFRSDALEPGMLRRLLEVACMAPSVGLSQPWRFVSVTTQDRRKRVISEFESQNELAASQYDGQSQLEYRRLKLAGLREAPEHLAVFIQKTPEAGRGLGRATMPESVAYSVVAAIQNFWLAARSEGIGVGWVSILRPETIASLLDVEAEWQLIAYLCIGYPINANASSPELERSGWEVRHALDEVWIER